MVVSVAAFREQTVGGSDQRVNGNASVRHASGSGHICPFVGSCRVCLRLVGGITAWHRRLARSSSSLWL